MRSLENKLTGDLMDAYKILIKDKTLAELKQQWIAKETDAERKEFLQTNPVLKRKVVELKQQRFQREHQGCGHSHLLKKPANQLLPVHRKRMTFQDFKDKFLKFLREEESKSEEFESVDEPEPVGKDFKCEVKNGIAIVRIAPFQNKDENEYCQCEERKGCD